MKNNIDTKELPLVYPLNLFFSPCHLREVITIKNDNENGYSFNMEFSPNFKVNKSEGAIPAKAEEKIYIECKSEFTKGTIKINFTNLLTNQVSCVNIQTIFSNNTKLDDDEFLNKSDDLSNFTFNQSDETIRMLAPISLALFIISCINFACVIYMIYFSLIDDIWMELIKKYHLREPALECSSWHKLLIDIHNYTCKVDSI